MEKTRLVFLICCFFLFRVWAAVSVPTYFCYKQLGIGQGLSQSRVQCMLYDYKGYLWIGTSFGLNCYDRDELKHYFNDPSDPRSLPSDEILFIAEDKAYNLWIGTNSGLCLFDRATLRFDRCYTGDKPVQASSYHLLDDGVLFAGIGDFFRYDYRTRTLERLPITTGDRYYSRLFDLCRLNDSVFYARTMTAVYSYDLSSHAFRKADYLRGNGFTALFIDSDRRVWISPYGDGLYCYDGERLVRHFTSGNSPLSYDVVLDMTEKDRVLWVATDGGGINLLSLDDFSFSHLRRNQDDASSFPADAVRCLYKDPNDNMWAGSIRNGLIGIKKVYARSFGNVTFQNPYGLSHPTVNCFFQDSEGKIWIGTDGGGVNCYDPAGDRFRHFAASRYEKVTAIIEYDRDELLISSFDRGVFYFNKRTGRLRPFILLDEKENREICRSGFSINLTRIDDGKIMINAKDIYVYDIREKSFRKIGSHGKDYVRYAPLIKKTADGKIYLMDYQNVSEYDRKAGTFRVIYEGEREITDMCIDKNGHLWMGSSDGLYFYDPRSGEKKKIRTRLFEGINSLAADPENRIWIGARNNLLFAYTIPTEMFALLGESDGVSSNEYLFDAMLVTGAGDVYVGGIQGMTQIDRDIRFDDAAPTGIELADVLLNGIPVREQLGNDRKPLPVPWNFSSLQFKVLVNENDVFRKDVFRYGIRGMGRNETTQSFKHSFTINSLPEGTYTISVSHIAQNGEWSRPADILQLVVTPPYWRTFWFISLCTLATAGLLASAGVWIYRRKRVKQRQEIERLKEQIYEDKIRFLINISHELRTPLTLICAPLKRLIDRVPDLPGLKEELAAIFGQASQMKHIIDRVLDIRKLEEGKERLNPAETDLNEWVRSVTAGFSQEAGHRGIRIDCRLDPAAGRATFDRSKCETVLANLVMNALKFSESGTTIGITTQRLQDRNRVRIEVKDQGVGLGDTDPQQLFGRFYQGAHGKGGSGIGLSYSKALVELHGGTIGAVPNDDRGACFFFELPLDDPAHPAVAGGSAPGLAGAELLAAEPADYAFLKNYSVLVVEDTDDLRHYLKTALSEYFARVYTAREGNPALEKIGKYQPDIIVSDVMMPGMNGFELCRTIKGDIRISHIPVILLTAYGHTDNMSIGYKLGADAFLAKPFDMDVLLSLTVNQLKLRDRIREKYRNTPGVPLQEITFSNADEAFLKKLNDLLRDQLGYEKLDVAFIAAHLGISRSLLFNKIKALTGMGIVNYVNKLRIERSAYLLRHSSLNITEISEAVGFAAPRYFSKVFKELQGVTPSAYREGTGDES